MKPSKSDIDDFLDGYARCALWSSNDESTPSGGEPLDNNYSTSDLTRAAKAKMRKDCVKFLRENSRDIEAYVEHVLLCYQEARSGRLEYAGHDFWLSRNGHGAGFWDRDGVGGSGRPHGPVGLGDRLQAAAEKFGECNLYVSRGKVHVD